MPTLYLTSAAAVATVDKAKARGTKVRPEVAQSVGPGRVFSILRVPPDWLRARVHGQVLACTPTIALLGAAFDGRRVAEGKAPSRCHAPRCAQRLRLGDGACVCGAAGITFAEYHDRLLKLWPRGARMAPGVLGWGMELTDEQAGRLRADGAPGLVSWDGSSWHGPLGLVEDGDTLVCTCGLGELCHRMVAAMPLSEAGWNIVYEGEPYGGTLRAEHWRRMHGAS